MLVIEDAIDAMDWGLREGGLKGLQARADANFAVIERLGERRPPWVDFLAKRAGDAVEHLGLPLDRRSGGHGARRRRARRRSAKAIVARLDKAGVAYDIGAYKDAPPGLRIWCGSTVETSDLEALTPWLDYAFASEKAGAREGRRLTLSAARHACAATSPFPLQEGAMPKVLVSDKLSKTAVQIFKDNGVEVDYLPDLGKDKDKLLEVIGQYDGLAIRSATKVTEKIIAAATNLKVIGRAGIGVDNVDIPAATKKGIIVMNTPFGNSITTAEHAISLMLSLARQIPEADASTARRQVGKEPLHGRRGHQQDPRPDRRRQYRLDRRRPRASGLKMKVLAFDPFLTPERAQCDGRREGRARRAADARRLHHAAHAADRADASNIISADAIAQMKPGVRIINCARGGLIDEAALAEALKSGTGRGRGARRVPRGAGDSNPLFELPNVICTPHLGASTTEAQENVALQVAEQISAYLMTGEITNALNFPSISAEEAPRLTPWVRLAEVARLVRRASSPRPRSRASASSTRAMSRRSTPSR